MSAGWAIILVAPLAAAGDDLSDFSNNLAQDLGPLLALFGESITRQYLSESTTFLDYLIFALCPIGIITAIVSAIRVCGHPSLRAFIGRSQEGSGVVEAELCTSTSRDVCELFNQGGITRVLGRPNVLELVCVQDKSADLANPDPHPDPDPDSDRVTAPTSARPRAPMDASGGQKVQLFQDYLEKMPDDHDEWKKQKGSFATSSDTDSASGFAPKPNLSLNVGIKRQPLWVFSLVALIGLVFQAGLVVLAGFGAWKWNWGISQSFDSSSKDYAPRMFISGTALLCLGMFGCAAIVGQATSEVTYKRQQSSASSSRLIWLQPGPQFVGDQSFDPFVHLEDRSKPLESWISSRKEPTGKKFQIATFAATMITLGGYVLQFIGLRGMKAWVSIAQLGITLIMAFLRCLLRMRRLGPKDSEFATIPDLVSGHELDWLAFRLALPGSSPRAKTFVENLRSRFSTGLGRPSSNSPSTDRQLNDMHGSYGSPSWHITGCAMLATRGPNDPGDPDARLMNDVQRKPHETDDVLERDGSSSDTSNQSRNRVHMTTQEIYEQLLSIRKTLANLTGNFSFEGLHKSQYQYWADEQVRVRSRAKQLAAAVGQAADSIIRIEHEGHKRAEITLMISASRPYGKLGNEQFREQSLRVIMRPPSTETHSGWAIDPAQAEAILGLWMWSLTYDENSDGVHNLRQVSDQREDEGLQIISAGLNNDDWEKMHNIQQEMDLWLGTSTAMIPKYTLLVDEDDTLGHEDLWVLQKGHHDVWEKYHGEKQMRDRIPHRFFGWNIVYQALGLRPCEAIRCAKSLRSISSYEKAQISVRIQCAPRRHALLDLCGRGLYTSLIGSLTKLNGIATSTILEHEGQIQLESRDVSAMVDAFVVNGLGSRTDAMMSIIPEFRARIRPNTQDMLTSILNGADTYRKAGEWDRSQLLLRWACREYSQPWQGGPDMPSADNMSAFVRVLQKTGELYRWSLARDTTQQRRQFGLDGIRWLDENYGSGSHLGKGGQTQKQDPEVERRDEEVIKVIDRYKEIATAFAAGNRAASDPGGTDPPLVQAIKSHDRAKTLYHLCFVREGDFGSRKLHPALPLVMRNKWPEVVEAILELRGNIDSQDEGGRTSASHCAELGLEKSLGDILRLGAFADLADIEGRTPVHWACFNGQEKTLKILVDTKQVDLHRSDAAGQSAIWHAMKSNNSAVVGYLCDIDIGVADDTNKVRETAIIWAVQHCNGEVVQAILSRLLDAKKYSIDQTDKSQRTLLYHAAKAGNAAAVNLLIEHGADMDRADELDWRPIEVAAERGHEETVRILLEAGANLVPENKDTRCLVARAAETGQQAVLRLLLHHHRRPDIDRPSRQDRTPLCEAAAKGQYKVAKMLLDSGASVNRADDANRTWLYWAAEKGFDDMVSLLLAYGAEMNRSTNWGETPLYTAAVKGYTYVVKILLDHGANPNFVDSRNKERKTSLLRAAERGHLAIVKLLLEHTANTNHLDRRQATALMYACENGHEDIVRILLDHGADVDNMDMFERNALYYAHKGWNKTIVQLLLDRGAVATAPRGTSN